MSTRPTLTAQPARIKGDCTAVVVIGRIIELWFAAPNGDSSDSVIATLYCHSEAQAEAIAERHRKVWGLDANNERV